MKKEICLLGGKWVMQNQDGKIMRCQNIQCQTTQQCSGPTTIQRLQLEIAQYCYILYSIGDNFHHQMQKPTHQLYQQREKKFQSVLGFQASNHLLVSASSSSDDHSFICQVGFQASTNFYIKPFCCSQFHLPINWHKLKRAKTI